MKEQIRIAVENSEEVDHTEVPTLISSRTPFVVNLKKSQIIVGWDDGLTLNFQPVTLTPEHLYSLGFLTAYLHIDTVREIMETVLDVPK